MASAGSNMNTTPKSPAVSFHRLCGTIHQFRTKCPRTPTFETNIKKREQDAGTSRTIPQSRPRRKNNKTSGRQTTNSRDDSGSRLTNTLPNLATDPLAYHSPSNTRERFNKVLAKIQNAINTSRNEMGQPPAYFARDLAPAATSNSSELQRILEVIINSHYGIPASEAGVLLNQEANLVLIILILRREQVTLDRIMLYVRRIREFIYEF